MTCSQPRAKPIRQKKAFLLLFFFIIFIWQSCAIAQTASSLIIVSAHPFFDEASAAVGKYKKKFPNAAVYEGPNGMYAAALGWVERDNAAAFLEKFKQSGDIPPESGASNISNWIGPITVSPATLPRVANVALTPARLNYLGDLFPKNKVNLTIRKSQRYDYSAYRIYIPAWNFASVTTMRQNGSCDMNSYVVEQLLPNTFSRATAQGLVAKNTRSDESPNTIVITAEDKPRTLILYSVDEIIDDCDYVVAISAVDIREAALRAGLATMLHMAFSDLFSTGANQGSAIADRLLPLASSMIQRDNMLSIGLDVAINEARLQIRKSFPNNEGMVVFGTEWISEILHGMYDDAFAMASSR